MKIKTSLALLSAFLGSFTLFAQTQTHLNTQPPSYSFSATISGGTLRLHPTDGLGVDTNKVIISGNGVLDLGNIPLSKEVDISGSASNSYAGSTVITSHWLLVKASGGISVGYSNNTLGNNTNVILSDNGILDFSGVPLSSETNTSVLTTNAYAVISNNVKNERFLLPIPTTPENILSSTNIDNNQNYNYNGYNVLPFRGNDTTCPNGITCLLVPSCHQGEASPKMEMNPSTVEEGLKAVKKALRVLEEEQLLLRE